MQVVSTPAGSWTGEKQITKIDSNTFYFDGSFGSGDTAGYYNGAATTTKKVTPVTLAAYLDDKITAMPALVSTSALDGGSITSNFGSINNGSSTITTTGAIAGGSFTIGGHSIDDIDIGSEFNDVDDHLMSSGAIKEKIEAYNYFPTTGGTIVGSLQVLNDAAAQLIAGYDINNKCTLSVVANGVTTLSTVGDGTNASDLTLDVDGDIELNADGGTITFKDDTTTLAEIDSSGNLLIIGALTERGHAHSIGTTGNTNVVNIHAVDQTTGTTAGKPLTIKAGSGVIGGSSNINGGDLVLASGAGDGTGTSSIQFQTKVSGTDAVAERMRIHTDGNVGIGVADPDTKLEVNGTTKITHAGTTTHGLAIETTALTTGRALYLDITDTKTTGDYTYLAVIDYDKTGVTASGQTNSTTGLLIEMTDDATNHASGVVSMTGITVSIDSDDAQGSIAQRGLQLIVAGDGVGDAVNTYGIEMEVMDGGTDIKLMSSADTGDYCSISTTTHGATTIATVDDDATAAHLTLDVDGDITLDADGGEIYLKDNGTTFGEFSTATTRSKLKLYEAAGASADDYFEIVTHGSGVTVLSTVDAAGAIAHLNIRADGHVEFDGCAVGFDLETPTYNASDTDVDFTNGNKQFVTFGAGNITDLNLIFPETSGNFVLLLKQDGTGSRIVTNYKAWDLVNSDAADGSATVKFAGGSNPTLTTDANHVDIISFFWDADNEIAYGVASLDFQF